MVRKLNAAQGTITLPAGHFNRSEVAPENENVASVSRARVETATAGGGRSRHT